MPVYGEGQPVGPPSNRLPPLAAMCSLALGAVVPMPTLTPLIPVTPSTRLLLCVTKAPAPMAVALLTLIATSAAAPITVLNEPATLRVPALDPKKELLEPVVLFVPAFAPKKELPLPVLLFICVPA